LPNVLTTKATSKISRPTGDQRVISSGPYRFVRHPGYTGVLLIVIGSVLVAGNWTGRMPLTATARRSSGE
jgi:protein-S-isoprenylcysteine O-methyltransferase Ste14